MVASEAAKLKKNLRGGYGGVVGGSAWWLFATIGAIVGALPSGRLAGKAITIWFCSVFIYWFHTVPEIEPLGSRLKSTLETVPSTGTVTGVASCLRQLFGYHVVMCPGA